MGIVEKGKVEKSHIIIVGMFRNQIIIPHLGDSEEFFWEIKRRDWEDGEGK
jgi:hypothetical protein